MGWALGAVGTSGESSALFAVPFPAGVRTVAAPSPVGMPAVVVPFPALAGEVETGSVVSVQATVLLCFVSVLALVASAVEAAACPSEVAGAAMHLLGLVAPVLVLLGLVA